MTPAEHLARRVAEEAHAGQVDKAGEPYIGHVERVVARLEDPLDRAVAWLHDVVEDTDVALGELWIQGLGLGPDIESVWPGVCRDVAKLTHRPNEPREDYYARVRTSERAVRVKLADIADNSDPERLAMLDGVTVLRLTGKYRKAREALLGEPALTAPVGDDLEEEK